MNEQFQASRMDDKSENIQGHTDVQTYPRRAGGIVKFKMENTLYFTERCTLAHHRILTERESECSERNGGVNMSEKRTNDSQMRINAPKK